MGANWVARAPASRVASSRLAGAVLNGDLRGVQRRQAGRQAQQSVRETGALRPASAEWQAEADHCPKNLAQREASGADRRRHPVPGKQHLFCPLALPALNAPATPSAPHSPESPAAAAASPPPQPRCHERLQQQGTTQNSDSRSVPAVSGSRRGVGPICAALHSHSSAILAARESVSQ